MRRKLLSHLTPQPSRAVVVAVMVGLVFSAAAIAAAGDLDPTFSGDGTQTTNFSSGCCDVANGVAIQSNGKIVVVGGTEDDFALARYNPNGTLDPNFSGDGKQRTNFGDGDQANGVALQGDGKIVVVGRARAGSFRFALARYNPNGALDPSFSGDGKQTTAFGGGEGAEANGVALQADGKIVAVGRGLGANGSRDFALARYNLNGSLDTSFSGDGKQTTNFGVSEAANAVALQANGKIVAVGGGEVRNSDFALARYNLNGSLDMSFSGDGKQTTDFGDFNQANGVAVQADGKIVAVGRGGGNNRDFALARYDPNGTLDSSFSSDGKQTTDFGFAADDAANGIAIQADGKIIAVGHAGGGTTGSDFALARYAPNAALDPTFSGDGKRRITFGGSDVANGVALQADGKIVAAGAVSVGGPVQTTDFALARSLGG